MSTQTTTTTQLINLSIDGKAVNVPKGTTVYQAARKLGIEIPIFCYQDRMPPFGACRMCLVEIEKMPKLIASCTQEAHEGMVVKTQSEAAVKGRHSILEFLLASHPLDCPICDRGGECPLQDNALRHGPGESRFVEEKRHFEKRVALGPVLMLDRERCIVCARCTRFGRFISGDHALELIHRGYQVEVGTIDGTPAESKFIGNTIMICPVGALTSQVYRFRARPWDNQPAESTCALCPIGCSLILDSRDGEIMRIRSRVNRDVNDIWLCDKGWFGYEFAGHPERLRRPLMRKNGKLVEADWSEALDLVAAKIKESKPSGKLGALGGNPLTVEENYLLQKLMREGAGVHNVDHRVGMPVLSLDEEGLAPGMEISIGECAELGFAALLGLDLSEEFPVIWLRLKQAINRGATVYFLGHFAPEISSHLAKTVLHSPGKEIETIRSHIPQLAALAEKGKNGAIFVGSQYLASPQRRAILSELLKLRAQFKNVSLNILEGRGNSFGARLAGMRPDVGPLGEKIARPGLNAVQMLETAAKSGWDFLYIAGSDPAAQFPSKLWKEARAKTRFLVAQDIFLTATAQQADVVLPALSFVEKGGRFINIEGRVQTFHPGKEIPQGALSDAEIFSLVAQRLGITLVLDKNFSEKLKLGRLMAGRPDQIPAGAANVAAASSGGALAATFSRVLFDEGVRMKHNPHLTQLVKAPRVKLHPQDAARRAVKDSDKVRISAGGNSFKAQVKLDDKVAAATVVLPLGFDSVPARELGSNLLNGMWVEITKGK